MTSKAFRLWAGCSWPNSWSLDVGDVCVGLGGNLCSLSSVISLT